MSADITPGKYPCQQTKAEYGVDAMEVKGFDLINNLDTYLIAQKVRATCNKKYGPCPNGCMVKQLQESASNNLKEFVENLVKNLS